MKKILLFLCLTIILPFILTFIFTKNYNLKLEKISNEYVRVKKSDGTIEEVIFDNYIIGVLAGEMPIYFEKEALKAQAVAARSYVFNKLDSDKNYDVVDTTDNQVYKDQDYLKKIWNHDYDKNINKLKTIISETENEFLFYNDNIINAFFFSTSSGKTENVKDVFGIDLPYLKSVDSKWDYNSPSFISEKSISESEFINKLNINKFCINNIVKNNSGSVKEINIDNKIFSGVEIRKIFNLNSTNFDITKINKKIIFINKGYGHGVGMSQYGAQNMAKNGYNYKEILNYYYKDVKILKK